ncbi:MAG: UbiX family flavin prenyltransferase [Phycisphaerae bacterium]
MQRRVVVGITGASGALYARRLVECLAASGAETHVIVSPHGRQLLRDELDLSAVEPRLLAGRHAAQVQVHGYHDLGDRLASGSYLTDGMIVCPASANTLGEIAAGLAGNLITRAAHVHLKEGRRLVVVPREMPLSRIDLENLLRISQAGGMVCPAAPGFYMRPRTLEDLADFVVGKLLDLVGVEHALKVRWGQPLPKKARPARKPMRAGRNRGGRGARRR